jgi:hypothetical protein
MESMNPGSWVGEKVVVLPLHVGAEEVVEGTR